jgi:SMC interacting uncharacterized protein involved in chromosome segregation
MLADLKVKSREVNKSALSLDIAVAKRSDAVEQALEEYMALVYKLGLHSSPPSEFSHISFTLELNGAASEPRNLIQGESLRGIIKPAILTVSESKRRERGLLNDERVKLENDLDVVTVECENLEQEVDTVETRIRLTNNEVEEIREVHEKRVLGGTDADLGSRHRSGTWEPAIRRSPDWKPSSPMRGRPRKPAVWVWPLVSNRFRSRKQSRKFLQSGTGY